MKTKGVLVIFLAIMLSMFYYGCSTYEDGPALSLATKNKRLTGEWQLTKYSATIQYTDWGTGETKTRTKDFDGSIFTEIYGGDTETYTYSSSLIIQNDGIYKWSTIVDGDLEEVSSSWTWLDGTSEKEQILFMLDGIYTITRLTDKELVFKTYQSYTEVSDGDTDVDIEEQVWTFTKK